MRIIVHNDIHEPSSHKIVSRGGSLKSLLPQSDYHPFVRITFFQIDSIRIDSVRIDLSESIRSNEERTYCIANGTDTWSFALNGIAADRADIVGKGLLFDAGIESSQ